MSTDIEYIDSLDKSLLLTGKTLLGDAESFLVPSAQTSGFSGDGWPARPEAPGWIHDVKVFRSLWSKAHNVEPHEYTGFNLFNVPTLLNEKIGSGFLCLYDCTGRINVIAS